MVNVLSSSSSMPITAPWANRERARERGKERESERERERERERGRERERERERARESERERETNRQSDSETRHTPLSVSTLMPSTCSSSPDRLAFLNYPWFVSSALQSLPFKSTSCLIISFPLTHTHTHTHTYPGAGFWNMAEKKGGDEEVGFWRAKEGGERQ